MNWNFIPKRSSVALSRRSSDGTFAIVLLNVSSHYFVVDGVRSQVWSMIDGRKTVKKIVEEICRLHGVDQSQCLKMIRKILAEFKKEKLLEP